METSSPITLSNNCRFLVSYEKSITSDQRLMDARVDKYLCMDTGLIFNASGPRGSETGFYMDEYELHNENEESEFKYFDNGKESGIYEEIADFIGQTVKFSKDVKLLDVGCGKGLLLKALKRRYPDARLHGVEPSTDAQGFFRRNFPEVSLFEGMLEDSPFTSDQFDLVVSNGVLEHVPYPVEFLKTIRSMLNDDGLLYIGVPNFENNPADIFTFDHLSHFSPQTLSVVFEMAGFEVVDSKVLDQRVPQWYLLRRAPTKELSEINLDVEESLRLAEQTLSDVNVYFESYQKAAEYSEKMGRKLAVYGTGCFAMIGTSFTDLKTDQLEMFVDDNSSIWGSDKLGIPVRNPIELSDSGVCGVVLSANPCYQNLIEEKVEALLGESDIVLHFPARSTDK